jgi:signal transduction histidine kinase
MNADSDSTDPTTRRSRGSAFVLAAAVACGIAAGRRNRRITPPRSVDRWTSDEQEGGERARERLHEIRSTIGGLAAAHQLLRDADDLPAARRQHLERLCAHEIVRLVRLVENGTSESAGRIDLDATIGPMVETLRLRGHQVRWHGSDDAPAWGRADDVAEIVHILLENSARHGAGEDVEVSTVSRGAFVDVHVRDQGPGVAADVAPRLFHRGVRRADSPGEGLGLSIAHRRAIEMGGRLRLAPAPPGRSGADFVLTLPTAAG